MVFFTQHLAPVDIYSKEVARGGGKTHHTNFLGWPRLGGLNSRNLFSHILEAGCLKSRCWQGHAPSKVSQGRILCCLSPFTFMTYILIFPLSSLGQYFRAISWAMVKWTKQWRLPSVRRATSKGGLGSPEGTQERSKEDWPTAEVHFKGGNPGSPDIYIFP